MGKRIIAVLAVIAAFVGILGLTVFLLNKASVGQWTTSPTLPSTSEEFAEPETTTTPKPEQTTEPVESDDRVVSDSFSDKVTIHIGEDDYHDKEDIDLDSLHKSDQAAVMDDYTFSNGFVVISKGNFIVDDFKSIDGKEVFLYDKKKNYEVSVYELDALQVDYDSLRKDYLKRWNLDTVIDDLLAEIPPDVEYDFKDGMEETPYVGGEGYNFSRGQFEYDLVSYCTKECAFGQADYVCVASQDNLCTGVAFVKCDNDRILKIVVTGDNHKECWGTIIEVTNNNIQLIK